MHLRQLVTLTALGEIATGLLLFAVPRIAVKLFLGAEMAGSGLVMSRFAGIALIGLGVACLPGRRAGGAAVRGIVVYSSLASVYLATVGFAGGLTGVLLWPAVALHVALTVGLVLMLRHEIVTGKGIVELDRVTSK